MKINDLSYCEMIECDVVGGNNISNKVTNAIPLVRAFKLGYKIGTKIDEATGLSDKIADVACSISGKC